MSSPVSETLLRSLELLGFEVRQWDFERALASGASRDGLLQIASKIEGFEALTDYFDRIGPDLPEDVIAMQHDPRWQEAMSMAGDALREMAPSGLTEAPLAPVPPNPVGTWEEYFDSMRRVPLHPLYAVLDPLLPNSGTALELGCGYGHGVQHLLRRGFEVWAMDIQGEALRGLYDRTPAELRFRLHPRVADMGTVSLPANQFEVLVAAYCLFFVPKETMLARWPDIVGAIRTGGLFMGQFLGPRDEWAAQGYTTHERWEVEALLAPFEVLHLEEVERHGATSTGVAKHWHVFHVIARKRDV